MKEKGKRKEVINMTIREGGKKLIIIVFSQKTII